MKQKSRSIVLLLFCLIWISHIHAQDRIRPSRDAVCNQNRTLCVNAAVQHSVVQNPFYFEVHVNCPDQVLLGWELRDDSGMVLDQDPEGRLAFLVTKASASERTLAVRDFAITPAKSSHGKLVLHAKTYTVSSGTRALPELSIPVRLDLRRSNVTYAVPAGHEFSQAVIDSVESDPAHRMPMHAEVDWRTTTLLYVQPAMLGGAAGEAAARADPGQGPWHVIDYSKAQGTAHLTILGDAWTGVTYYLTGLNYLLEKTVKHQADVRRVVFDRPADLGN